MYLLIAAHAEEVAELALCAPERAPAHAECRWPIKRDLAQCLLFKIKTFLTANSISFEDLSALGVYAGPASFTNLRITHTIANTLAYALQIPIVNAPTANWQQDCRRLLKAGEDFKIVKPFYGRPARITKRKK